MKKDTFLGSYGGRYPTSLVFYSGDTVYRTDEAKEIANMVPKAMKWSSTNVMPLIDIADLPWDRDVLALVDKKKTENFLRIAEGDWILLKDTERYHIYARKAIAENRKGME